MSLKYIKKKLKQRKQPDKTPGSMSVNPSAPVYFLNFPKTCSNNRFKHQNDVSASNIYNILLVDVVADVKNSLCSLPILLELERRGELDSPRRKRLSVNPCVLTFTFICCVRV